MLVALGYVVARDHTSATVSLGTKSQVASMELICRLDLYLVASAPPSLASCADGSAGKAYFYREVYVFTR